MCVRGLARPPLRHARAGLCPFYVSCFLAEELASLRMSLSHMRSDLGTGRSFCLCFSPLSPCFRRGCFCVAVEAVVFGGGTSLDDG